MSDRNTNHGLNILTGVGAVLAHAVLLGLAV